MFIIDIILYLVACMLIPSSKEEGGNSSEWIILDHFHKDNDQGNTQGNTQESTNYTSEWD